MKTLTNFIDHAAALMQILNPGLAPRETGWTMAEAVDRLSAEAWRPLKASDWREIAIYLAMQLMTAQTKDGDRERMALFSIQSVLDRLAEDVERDKARAAQAAIDQMHTSNLFGDTK